MIMTEIGLRVWKSNLEESKEICNGRGIFFSILSIYPYGDPAFSIYGRNLSI